MPIVPKVINFIRAKGLNHDNSKNSLKIWMLIMSDYFLLASNMTKERQNVEKIQYLRNKINSFMEAKKRRVIT